MKKLLNRILVSICLFCLTIFISNVVKAESVSSSKSSVTVGESFTVTISGVNGKAVISSNDKVSLSVKGTQWIYGSLTITGQTKSVGTATVTISFIDATTKGKGARDISNTSKRVSVTVKEKEQPKPTNPTTQPTPTTTKPQPTKTTTKKTTTKKTETKKQDEKKTEITPTEEKEEATPEWGIADVKLVGIKENGEKVEIELDKQFNINTYDYTCNVTADIKKIEVNKEAYEYNEFVTISGVEEELKPGENIITLKLSKEGQNDLIYTIKVNKEEQTEEVNAEVLDVLAERKDEKTMINMPIWAFILMEIAIIAATAGISVIVTKEVISKKSINK